MKKVRSRGCGRWRCAADGAGRILVRPRLATHDGAGLAVMKARDLSAAWWRTPRG